MQIVLVSCELIYFHKEFSTLRQAAHDTLIRMAREYTFINLYICTFLSLCSQIRKMCRMVHILVHLSTHLFLHLRIFIFLQPQKIARRCRHRIAHSIQSYALSLVYINMYFFNRFIKST